MRPFTLERLGEMLADSPANTVWRHDVDVSLPAAVRMATLEADLGVVATFYVMTTSPFYSAADAAVFAIRAVSLGHRVGLHLDPSEGVNVEELRGTPVSFHCPNEFVLWRDFATFESAYASRWLGRYVSDSRGVFADGDPEDRFDSEPLQVNLHAEWWFDRASIDWIPDAEYEAFFHESKEQLACV